MQLLLFLSALLAGLTGAFSGDRAVRVGGQLGDTAITRTAEAAAEIAVSLKVAIAVPRAAARPDIVQPGFARTAPPLALPARLTTGRRLE